MLSLERYKKKFSHFLNFRYNCVKEDRYIYVENDNNQRFETKTPFLRVLKPFHTHKNKNYLILEISEDLDFSNETSDFIYIINKIHEYSQENIKAESKIWFNKEFDIYELDNMVKRPVEESRSTSYIKIVIPNDEEIENRLLSLSKDSYISCNIEFIGLKISREMLSEEWGLIGFMTQREMDEKHMIEYSAETLSVENIEEENIREEMVDTAYFDTPVIVEEKVLEENIVLESNRIEETNKQEEVVENNQCEEPNIIIPEENVAAVLERDEDGEESIEVVSLVEKKSTESKKTKKNSEKKIKKKNFIGKTKVYKMKE